MTGYTRDEKSLAMHVTDLLEAADAVEKEMKHRDWAVTADENQRTIYQRLRRATVELDAARHFVARMQIANTLTVRPARPVEDPMFAKTIEPEKG